GQDWLIDKEQGYQRTFLARQIEISRQSCHLARESGISYFDTGLDFDEGLTGARAFLTARGTRQNKTIISS
ncbi:MAG: hypothetical protein ACC634_10050, partial [Hyphomicrobiales bacterium]